MQAPMVRLLQVLKLSMDNTSTLMTEAKLRVVLLRMQMVLIASMMSVTGERFWLSSSSQQGDNNWYYIGANGKSVTGEVKNWWTILITC